MLSKTSLEIVPFYAALKGLPFLFAPIFPKPKLIKKSSELYI